jgi:hypothetical protein
VVFDLWTGQWVAGDAAERGVPRILAAVALLGTMMFGPAGLLLHHLVLRPLFPAGQGGGPKKD